MLLPAVALPACGGSGAGQAGPAIKGTIVFASPHGRAATIELLDSHGVRRLARDGSVVASHPVWSPDGREILAGDASDSSGQGVGAAQGNVYVLRANGHGLHALAKPGAESDAV
ncbi:MAG: hypothetical protein ACXVYM_04875 [Gaiellaceae bacterium]